MVLTDVSVPMALRQLAWALDSPSAQDKIAAKDPDQSKLMEVMRLAQNYGREVLDTDITTNEVQAAAERGFRNETTLPLKEWIGD